MMAWWTTLAPRERLFLTWGGIAALVMVIYMGVLEPLDGSVEQAESRLQASQAQLGRLNAIATEYKQLGKGKARIKRQAGGSLLAVIDKASAQFGLKSAIKRLNPEGKTKVRVQLQDVSFDKLIAWLSNLAKTHGINIEVINVRKSAKLGNISANLMLRND